MVISSGEFIVAPPRKQTSDVPNSSHIISDTASDSKAVGLVAGGSKPYGSGRIWLSSAMFTSQVAHRHHSGSTTFTVIRYGERGPYTHDFSSINLRQIYPTLLQAQADADKS